MGDITVVHHEPKHLLPPHLHSQPTLTFKMYIFDIDNRLPAGPVSQESDEGYLNARKVVRLKSNKCSFFPPFSARLIWIRSPRPLPQWILGDSPHPHPPLHTNYPWMDFF